MTHTPGPWHEAQDEHDPDMLMVTTKERTEQNYAPIANIDVNFSLAFDKEQRANARLIAAAPDLLTTGKHLALKLAAVYREVGVKPSECQAIRDFMLSVAKAEGRS